MPASNPWVSLPASATIAGQGDTISTSVAPRAVPLPPVPTLTALCTVPGAGILDDLSQAERVPVGLVTLAAAIQVDELL